MVRTQRVSRSISRLRVVRFVSRFVNRFAALMLLFGGVCTFAVAARTISAKSAALADVQRAVLESTAGDTVFVPSGTVYWDNSLLMKGDVELQGAGAGETIIHNSRRDWGNALVTVAAQSGKSFRIDGFTFGGPASPDADKSNNSDSIVITGSTDAFRIDHNLFSGGGAHSIWIHGASFGVIDHNQFLNASREVISLFGQGSGDDAWNEPLDLGTRRAVYAEDNTFQFVTVGDHAITGVNGARYVFRHNSVSSASVLNSSQVDVHGNFFDARSARSFEIYDNQLSSGNSYQGMYIRGGSGVIFGNTFEGKYYHPIVFTQYRGFRRMKGTKAGPCGFTACGYPSADQISRTYVWDNSYAGSSVAPFVDDRGAVRSLIVEGRDYFLKPMPNYTPYPYPHPLTQFKGSGPPSYP